MKRRDNPPPSRFRIFLPTLVLLLSGTCLAFAQPADPAAAQSPPTEQAPSDRTTGTTADPRPAAPAFIPLEEIVVTAQEVRRQLTAQLADLGPPPLLETIRKGLPEVRTDLDRIEKEVGAIGGTGRAGRQLSRLRGEIATRQKRLNDWQGDLVSLTRQIQSRLSALAEAETLWINTGKSLSSDEGAESLAVQVEAVIGSIRELKATTTAQRDEALRNQAAVSTETNRVSALQREHARLSEISRSQLLRPDSHFIWEIREINREDRDLTIQFGSSFRSEWETFSEFALLHSVNLTVQFIILAVSAAFLINVRRRHQEALANDPRLRSASSLLNHPFATGIVIALLLTPVFYSDPPDVVYRYAVFAILIPVTLLLRTTLRPELKRFAYATIFSYFLVRIGVQLPDFSAGQRLISLFVAVLGTLVVLRQIREARGSGPNRAGTPRLDLFAARAGIIAFPAAALTNTFGLFVLSDKLLSGYLNILIIGLILIAGCNAIHDCLRIAMVVGPLRHLSAVRLHFTTVDRTLARALNLAAIVLWVVFTLVALGLFPPVWAGFMGLLGFGWRMGALNLSVGSILVFILTIWVAVILSKSIRFVLDSDVLPRLELPRGIPATISMFINYAIITLGFIIALAAAGIHLSQISILIGALGVGIGFGLQNLVNNFVSGLILIFERPIKVGDKIQFGTNFGEVKSIGIRASNVRSFDGAEVIVPNGNLISNEVTNWTLSDQHRRMDVKIGVAYGTDPEKVIALLADTIARFDEIMKDPEPLITFDAFGESSLDFTARFWTADFSLGLRLKSAVLVAVNRALAAAGIEIPFPQRDLHVRSVDSAAARALRAPTDADAPP